MDTYEVNVIVGLTPSAQKIITKKDIERLFQKSEQLFLKLGNIDVTFVIQQISEWDPGKTNKMTDKRFEELCIKHAPPLNDIYFERESDIATSLYYMLGNLDADIWVGFFSDLEVNVYGYYKRCIKSCICSLDTEPHLWPIILTNETMHILGVGNEFKDKQSIMYCNVVNELLKRPELEQQLTLNNYMINRIKRHLEKIRLNRLK